MSAPRWVRVGAIATLRFDPAACVQVEGRELAVFRDGSTWRAMENSCPHQGASLAEGDWDDGTVGCSWHGWRFDIRSGACVNVPGETLRVYPARETEGILEVDLGG
ncbi:MAG: Rieske (2Fe-2S) protein [Planctomycetes bacterium]|nr:Rieske (2Fe-2S) protein [Planctomycetota bacterium]